MMQRNSDSGGEKRIVRVHTFGRLLIECGSRSMTPDAALVFALVIILVMQRGEWVSRDLLRRLLWPQLAESASMQRLRQALYMTRAHYGIPLETSTSGARLDPEFVDADYHRLLDSGSDLRADGMDLANAYFLRGYDPTFSPALVEMVDTLRSEVDLRLRRLLSAELQRLRDRGDWSGVERIARRYLQLDPLSQQATSALAEAFAVVGRQGDAISLLDSYLLEAGSDAGISVKQLRQRIYERLNSDPYLTNTEGVFVGRAASMLFLTDSLMRTRAGAATSVYIWGAPGMGKTRLVDEYCRGAVLAGAQVQKVTLQVTDQQRPLSVFSDLVPYLQTMPGVLGCDPETFAYLKRLSTPDAQTAQTKADYEDAESLAGMIRKAIFDIFDAVTSESLVIVVLEDIHWADDRSLRLLKDLMVWSVGRQLQFILTSRSPVSGSEKVMGGAPDNLLVHHLSPLPDGVAEELLQSVAKTRGESVPAEFVDWAVPVAEGNPFYLRELLSKWLLTHELYVVPPTLGSLLGNRIQVLSDSEQRLLQGCAVLRRHARLDRLQSLLGYSNIDLINGVERLGALGLVVAEGELVECRHELIVDAAITQLSESGRQAMYRLAATMLEQEAEQTTGMSVLWDSTRLWHLAGDVERAVSLACRCAGQMITIGAPRDSSVQLSKTLALCATDDQRLRVLQALVASCHASAQYSELREAILAKQSLAARLRIPRLDHSDEELMMLDASWRIDLVPDRTLAAVLRCTQSRAASRIHRLEATLLGLNVCDSLCDVENATAFHMVASSFEQLSETERATRSYAELMFHTTFGELTRARQAADEVLAYARGRGSFLILCRSLRHVASTFRRCGEHDRAVECLTEALETARTKQIGSGIIPAIEGLIQCYLDIEEIESAAAWYAHALEFASTVEDTAIAHSVRYLHAEIETLRGGRPSIELLSDPVLQRLAGGQSVRAAAYASALLAATAATHSEPISNAAMSRCLQLHAATRARGGQDFPTYCLALALCYLERGNEAEEFTQSYLHNFRRERGAAPERLHAFKCS